MGFKHNSAWRNSKCKGPSGLSTSVLKEARKPITFTAGLLPTARQECTTNSMCTLQASKTIIAGGKKQGCLLFCQYLRLLSFSYSSRNSVVLVVFLEYKNVSSTKGCFFVTIEKIPVHNLPKGYSPLREMGMKDAHLS